MAIKRCLVLLDSDMIGDYYNLNFAHSSEEIARVTRAASGLRRQPEPVEFEVPRQSMIEKHFLFGFYMANKQVSVLLSAEGEDAVEDLSNICSDLREFLGESLTETGAKVYARNAQFLREYFGRIEIARQKAKKIDALQQNLEVIRDETSKNFKKILARGRDIEELSFEASNLSVDAHHFKNSAVTLKDEFVKQKQKRMFLMISGSIFAVLFLYLFFF